MSKNPLWNRLHEIKLETVMAKDPQTICEDDTLEKTVKILQEHKIHSLPVLDRFNKVVGVIDNLDITAFLLKIVPKDDDLKSLEQASRAMHLKEVKSVMEISGRDPFVPLHTHDPLTLASGLFGSGVHRCPVLDSSQKLVGMVSQGHIVAAIHHSIKLHNGMLGMARKSLKDLSLGLPSNIVTAKRDTPVLTCIRRLVEFQINALALVDSDGKLAGTFSASDVRGLFLDTVPDFGSSVEEFLLKHSPMSFNSSCVRIDCKFEDAMDLFHSHHVVHRLWVIDEKFRPVGIVSLTDVCQMLKNYVQ